MKKTKNLKKICVTTNTLFSVALEAMDSAGCGLLCVVDKKFHLLGILTEGDFRKAIMGNVDRMCPVSNVMNTCFVKLNKRLADEDMLSLMNRHSHAVIRSIPIVDSNGILEEVVFRSELIRESSLPNSALIMAGGYGRRMGELTKSTPKPMLEVAGVPIIEKIIGHFRQGGIAHFYISVHYLADVIKDHLGDGSKYGARITYLEEEESLGTAGALGLIDDIQDSPLIMINGDLLACISVETLLDAHLSEDNDITIGIKEYGFSVPFGVVQFNADHRVEGITEKPKAEFFVNTGIYVLSQSVISSVKRGSHLDMPDLIRSSIASDRRVGAFYIRETWLDIGTKDSYKLANEMASM